MSGHSKWSTIKRKKAANDAKRGKLFTRLLREVTVSAREGGGDPAANARLRAAIQEAKNGNVPSDTIDRAIKKGTGELEGATYEEVTYEGYGPGGVAVLVETMTDNRNRTVGEIRHLFSKHGGNLGENGCVGWMFDQRGLLLVEGGALDEDEAMELALELGVEDVEVEPSGTELICAPERFLEVRDAIEAKSLPLVTAELAMIPQSVVEVESGPARQVVRLLEGLEEQDDVQNVWANIDPQAMDEASEER